LSEHLSVDFIVIGVFLVFLNVKLVASIFESLDEDLRDPKYFFDVC